MWLKYNKINKVMIDMFGKKVKKKYRIYQDTPYFTSFEYTYASQK